MIFDTSVTGHTVVLQANWFEAFSDVGESFVVSSNQTATSIVLECNGKSESKGRTADFPFVRAVDVNVDVDVDAHL